MHLNLELTTTQLEQMIIEAKAAHTEYEKSQPGLDHATHWPIYYAGFIMARLDALAFKQWLERKAARAEAPAPAGEVTVSDLVRAVGKFATGPTDAAG
jgi:hypothetical protein